MAELVDGVIQKLLSIWDKLEPVALGGSGMSGARAALQMPADTDGGGCITALEIVSLLSRVVGS